MTVEGDEVPDGGVYPYDFSSNGCLWSTEDGDHLIRSHKIIYQDRNGFGPPTKLDPSTCAFLVLH